jgi:hypothetical protein
MLPAAEQPWAKRDLIDFVLPNEASYPFSTYSFDRVFADSGYINCTDMCPSPV